MKEDTERQELHCIPGWTQSVEEGIPIQDPVFMGQVDYIKGKIDKIYASGLNKLRPDMLESMREWLQEILDSWPNRPEK